MLHLRFGVLLLTALLTLSGAAGERTVAVQFTGAGPSCGGTLRAERICREPECRAAATEVDAGASSNVSVVISDDALWRFVYRGDTCWAPVVMTTTAGETTLRINRWRKGVLRGHWSGSGSPAHLDVTVQSPPEVAAERVPESSLPCAVTGSEWRCEAPAATLDVRIFPEGFTPHYLWNVAIGAETPVNAGEIPLTRGASIAGWVEGARKGVTDVRVQLTPESMDTAAGAMERSKARTVTTTANARGFFQFRNVSGGSYAIAATANDRSSARISGVSVHDEREHLLETPLRLAPIAMVTIDVNPPATPLGSPWIVRMQQKVPFTPYSLTIAEGTAEGGTWRGELEPGKYEILVADISGSVHERLVSDIASGGQTIHVAVQHIAVEGRVHAGDEGIAAELLFMSNNASVTLQSDEDGRFSGMLPGEGHYGVRIRQPRMRRERTIDVKTGDDGTAKIDLSLPPGRLAGVVVDSMGKGLSATVTLLRQGKGIATQFGTDESDGTFDVRGLDTGEALVYAMAGDGESRTVPVTISESSASRLRLVVADMRKLHGLVTNRAGEPIAGALVRVVSEALPDIRETPTGMNGAFEVEIPKGVPAVDVVVVTPGLPTKIVRTMLSDDSNDELTIRVGGVAGRLMVRMDSAPPWPRVRRDQGTAVPMTQLMPPPEGFGRLRGVTDGGVFVDLEPGEYTVCGSGPSADKCETRLVAAASVEVVDARPWGKK